MVLIPAGTFMMGSPDGVGDNDEHPQHQVSVQSFYMGKYEVTQAQWRAVMGTNPSNFKGDNLPVENVSWNDATEFCRKLSQMTGREYRLPSEAEWEYACRAGTTGDYAGNLDAMAWYFSNSGSQTHPVGQKQPNSFGLYDMHGNVWEQCEDWYHDSYNGAPTDGSAWLSGGDSSRRVYRGGSWGRYAVGLRSANRNGSGTGYRDDLVGLRVVAVSRSS
jgi:formylglycine-generating enzyme required for sulfatase activity